VVDDADELVAERVPGAETLHAAGASRHPAASGFDAGTWQLALDVWRDTVALHRAIPNRWYGVTHFHDPADGSFLCWYVNFERPMVRHRTAALYDTLDLCLDLIVMPDGAPIWKDEDHWAWAIDAGVFTDEAVASVEACRDDLLAAAAARTHPFDDRWLDWRPDPHDEPAQLPDGWQTW
jgi:predicted RNA-binding protein associated with RNAse of E/G family